MNRLIEIYILRLGKEKFADMLAKSQLPTEYLENQNFEDH